MPRAATKFSSKKPKNDKAAAVPAEQPGDVLTLAEAAAYLRVTEQAVLGLVGPAGLPGRAIGTDWRFSKSAIQHWLGTPTCQGSKEAVLSAAGMWKDDPELEQEVKEIYKRRGRPSREGGA
jgi:excisionase family DNA binding protein